MNPQNTGSNLGFLKWVAVVVTGIVVVEVAFLLITNPNILASVPFIESFQTHVSNVQQNIPARIVNKNASVTYDIQSLQPLEAGLNTYALTGKFVKVNQNNSLLYLSDSFGNTYVFNIQKFILRDPKDTWLKIYTIPNISAIATYKELTTNETSQTNSTSSFTTSVSISLTHGDYSTSLNELTVRWDDTRSLSQVESDNRASPNSPLNPSSDSTILAEIQ